MSILKIARMGHPVLHKIADPVTDLTDPSISLLVDDMIETLEDIGGIGLAAPQVYNSKRIVVFFIPKERNSKNGDEQKIDLTVMINPEIEPIDQKKELDWEACLSVPDLMGAVPRYTRINYRWTNLDGTQSERVAGGFHARAVQHECDHLDGILYPMRMSDISKLGYSEEMAKAKEKEMEEARGA